ncbi:MAG TPA: type II toxin-antitoxin system mRNA interferase toxin, RelE/StbE family [Candidatus Limnocylindria bacterium]|nr:type II toxin-antitoxin system mRNA interferase toxin, RelE/StbE family [Candidatus Limnocylindria bacterium]
MRIRRHKSFEKDYLKLKPAQRERLKKAFILFVRDPTHPDLYNHPLTGEWTGYRSIAFGGDWRAHYKVVDSEAFFVACGTHSQLYK